MKSPEILNSFRTSSNFRRKCFDHQTILDEKCFARQTILGEKCFARQTILEEKCFARQTILGKKCFACQTILEAEANIQAKTPPNAGHFAQEFL